MDKTLQRGIVIVFITNIINLFFSFATNFLLPKFLSVECYAGIKTFQLYITYIGLLHFGFVDSVYLNNGGKELGKKLDSSFSLNMSTLRVFETGVAFITSIIGVITKDCLLIFFALSILPINMNSYFKYLFQATGNFLRYGRIMNISTIATFLVNILIIFVFKFDNYYYVVALYVLLNTSIWLYLEYSFKKSYELEKSHSLFSRKELISGIKSGIFLTVGNLASLFLSSMDRWFVKVLLDTTAFAQYSFAVSVEGFLNIAITPITTTLYNFFCRESDEEKHKHIFRYVVIFATLLPCAAFPVKFILEVFLQAYLDASKVIFMLFGAQIFFVVINAVFVNIYKANKQQHIYFIKLVIILAIGFLLNVMCYQLLKEKEAFAIGTLVSAILWFILSAIDFRYLRITVSVVIYIFIELSILLILGIKVNAIIGFVLYIAISLINGFLFLRKTYIQLLKIAFCKLKRS